MNKAIISYSEKNTSDVYYGVIDLTTMSITQITSPFNAQIVNSNEKKLENVTLLAPTMPSKIIAVGLNYRDHAKEFNFEIPKEPLLFSKPPSAIIAHNDTIQLPKASERVDYEAELAIIIKERAKNIEEKEAKNYILGYTCANDVTARDLQQKDNQWTRSKAFDTFAPLGPWIIPAKDLNPNNINIIAKKNGKIVQSSNTDQMIFSPYKLVSYISEIMTLLPGDVIITGTPSGVGPLQSGDCIEVEIENIGTLKNYVANI